MLFPICPGIGVTIQSSFKHTHTHRVSSFGRAIPLRVCGEPFFRPPVFRQSDPCLCPRQLTSCVCCFRTSLLNTEFWASPVALTALPACVLAGDDPIPLNSATSTFSSLTQKPPRAARPLNLCLGSVSSSSAPFTTEISKIVATWTVTLVVAYLCKTQAHSLTVMGSQMVLNISLSHSLAHAA